MHTVPATWQPDWDACMKQLGSVFATSRFWFRQAVRQGVRRQASHLELEAAYGELHGGHTGALDGHGEQQLCGLRGQ